MTTKRRKITKTKRRGLGGETEIRELSLYMANDYPINRQLKAIDLNQAKKVCKGVWDVQKSAKLYQYAVDEAARKYGKEFGSGRSLKTAPFSITDRRQLALDLANDFKSRAKSCIAGPRASATGCGDVSPDVEAVFKKCKLPITLAGLGRARRGAKKRRK